MESHAGFLFYLTLASGRSLGLGLLAWLALRLCRAKAASAKHAVWTIVTAVMLLQAFVSPVLPALPIRILAPAADITRGVTPQLPFAPAPAEMPGSHGRSLTSRQVVEGIYEAVTLVFLGRLIVGYLLTRRLVRQSTPIGELPASPVARLHESEWISVPITVGQIAPTILLPPAWRKWDSAQLQAVLAHEEAHVRRADWAIGVLASLNTCLFWFHPLAWWLKGRLAQLAEFACDDDALACVGDRQQYARTLLEIACAMKSARGRLLRDAVSMAKETNVRKRMDQILDETRRIPAAFGRRGWVTLLACSLPLAYVASTVQLAPAQTRTDAAVPDPPKPAPQMVAQVRLPAPVPMQTPAASPYQRWVDEVVYILSDEERSAFARLTSDDERQMFIEQFWLRRDPTPDTPENEFKAEHYRRIAFAIDRFTSGIPGWQTDRGMVYIRYGDPDTLDTYSATPFTYPYEKWRYRYVEGFGTGVEFEFVDPTMTGRYRLTRDPAEKETRR